MTYVVIDIETVENERAKELFAKKTYLPASNLRDPAKIEQSILERRQKDMDQAALHWWTGKIICICANVLVPGHKSADEDYKPLTLIGDDEKELLCQFFDKLERLQERLGGIVVIGKSGDYFDLPFIVGRALAHDLGVPQALRTRDTVRDIDHIFSFSSQCDQRSSLDNYAFGLGLKGKTGHGSQIAGLYAQIQMGETDKWQVIGDYCANDTDIATTMLKRWIKPYICRNPVTKPVEELEIPFG